MGAGRFWILGPWRDLGFFVLTPALIIPLVLAMQSHVNLSALGVWVLGIGGFGHHLPGFIRAYSDPELFRQYKVRFIVAPILLALVCGLFSYYDLNAVTLTVAVWGAWHGAMQIHGFLRIYDAKVKSFAPATAWLDWLMCLTWFALAILHSPVKQFALFSHFYLSGGPLISPVGLTVFRHAWDAGTAIIAFLFLANTFRQWKKGVPPSPVKLLTMAAGFSFWWYCMVTLNNLLLGVILWEIFHDIQYNAIVWLFERRHVDADRNAGWAEKFLFRPGAARLAFYTLLIAGYGYIGVVSSYVDIQLPEKIVTGETSVTWMLRVLAVSAFLYFYYDGFIWRVRNPNTRKGLGLEEGEKTSSDPDFLPVSGIRHGLKWVLFAAPVLVLGLAQHRGGNTDQRRMFANLIQTVPESWFAHYMYATFRKLDGDYRGAAEHYRKAVRYNPGSDQAHMFLSDMLYKLGEDSEALEQYRKAVELEPADAEARNNLGYLYLRAGRPEKAEEQFRAALTLAPDEPDPSFGMGEALLDQQRFHEAEPYLRQTLSVFPQHSGALEGLGRIREAEVRDSVLKSRRSAEPPNTKPPW